MCPPVDPPLCPVCGYGLDEEPWVETSPSDEICSSCGIHFGYDDHAAGDPGRRAEVYRTWRQRWIVGGMRWWSEGSREILPFPDAPFWAVNPPPGWDPAEQLRRIGIDAAAHGRGENVE
jgi:hypothetical protein